MVNFYSLSCESSTNTTLLFTINNFSPQQNIKIYCENSCDPVLLNKITGHKQNINILQFTHMYEIENKKKLMAKKKKDRKYEEKKSLSLANTRSQRLLESNPFLEFN